MPTANPLLGVVFHWLGGAAAGGFYTPYRFVRHWSWEVLWLTGGVFSWIVAPWVAALLYVPHPVSLIREAGPAAIGWAYLFGALWGIGGLTFGLTMRYLGISLGYAVALGLCSGFGTLIPPIFHGTFAEKMIEPLGGKIGLLGIGVSLVGIAISGMAGMSKERELSDEQKRESVREFNFAKGLTIAVVSGVMSACMAFALDAADPIKKAAVDHNVNPLWQGLPPLIVILLGGFTTNVIWCVALMLRNRTAGEYVRSRVPMEASRKHDRDEDSGAAAQPGGVAVVSAAALATPVPLLRNYLLCAAAGITWYLQFFFYTMGESQMGAYKFTSWTIHMASIIIFSTLLGIGLKEWRGTGQRTRLLLATGLFVLVASTVVIGYGNKLAADEEAQRTAGKTTLAAPAHRSS